MRSTNAVFSSVAAVLFASALLAGDPGQALKIGRESIQQKHYPHAVKVLQEAVPDAAAIADERVRAQAHAALHFYTAIAFSGMNDEKKTREELELFFLASPQTDTIDATKYDKQFVRYFNEVIASLKSESSISFDAVYPGYRSFAVEKPKSRALSEWDRSPEFAVLATTDERRQWKALADDDARYQFVESFWKDRDAYPATEGNETREEFDRRVAFADYTFGTEQTRGALSDRGRVFVLIGAPRVVRIKPLNAREGGSSKRVAPFSPSAAAPGGASTNPGRDAHLTFWKTMEISEKNASMPSAQPILKGNVERWVFGRDQLPKSVTQTEVVFKFITEQGYGTHVLQRDFWVLKAMQDAAKEPWVAR